jgi:hypothetical protein
MRIEIYSAYLLEQNDYTSEVILHEAFWINKEWVRKEYPKQEEFSRSFLGGMIAIG